MTTLAYRAGILAADSLVTCNGLRDGHVTKIVRIGKVLVGGSGSSAVCLRFREWVAAGLKGDSPFQDGDSGNGLVVSEAGVVCWSGNGPVKINMPFYSLGSGYQVALGAMDQGASAEEAVRAAIRWDIGSGGEVTVLRLDAS